MPFYMYRCSKCEGQFQIFHGITETKVDCPICESENSLKKQLTAFNIISDTTADRPKKDGEVVERSIKEYRESLKEQIEQLKEHSNDFKD